MIRQSAFKGLREDKPAKEVRAEYPVALKVAELATPAPNARSKTAKAIATVIMGVTISHPDKALWPAEKDEGPVTKRDLVIYLEKVGALMIEHLKGRPCSIIRAPDGIKPEVLPAPRHA